MPEAPAALAWSRRLGIRARLLALLLPPMSALVALDSWTDYHSAEAVVARAYDDALLQPVFALNDGLTIDAKGEFVLARPYPTPPMALPGERGQKFLHVRLSALDATGQRVGPQRTLAGVPDLPATPAVADLPDAPAAVKPLDLHHGHGGAIVELYDAQYLGQPMRVAALRRVVQDGAGRSSELQIRAAEDTQARERAGKDVLRREVLANVRMQLVTALIVWIGLAWALKPLERLREMLQRPAQEGAPLDPSSVPTDVVPLVEAVNYHSARYQRILAQQAEFLADASHQLRTPLAIMMTQAGYALRERDPQHAKDALRAILDQLSRSRRLCDQLLAMAHASRPEEATQPVPLADLGTVAREVALQYLALAREKQQDLGWADAGGDAPQENADAEAVPVPVRAHAAELHEALANLLHNAIRHTPPGGRITVAVRIADGCALAEVRDSGPGLPPERHESVFRRFHADREASTPAGATRGAGLGLAIARAYVRRNGGDISFGEGETRADGGRGLCARLRLPLAGSPGSGLRAVGA